MVLDPEDGNLHHDWSCDLSCDLQDKPCPCNERRKDERDDGGCCGCHCDASGGVSVHQEHRETQVLDVSDRMDHSDESSTYYADLDLVHRSEHYPACN